ncbi:hypothetical protein Hypma_012653 [Hypsizygus marmoreus]|uniref:Uncharacterized protein n=1 Tax=Hypsizygus marmoreus TaxID=39966 RepID=A0A369JIA9_HYPMA|nr:hypothetical protein Hypma_012653 [Hypsizygus marmoreus]
MQHTRTVHSPYYLNASHSTPATIPVSLPVDNTVPPYDGPTNISRTCGDIEYTEFRAYGPPSPTFGHPGDIYINVSPKTYELYARDNYSWFKWGGPLYRYHVIKHPLHEDYILQCSLKSGPTWSETAGKRHITELRKDGGVPSASDCIEAFLDRETTKPTRKRKLKDPSVENKRSKKKKTSIQSPNSQTIQTKLYPLTDFLSLSIQRFTCSFSVSSIPTEYSRPFVMKHSVYAIPFSHFWGCSSPPTDLGDSGDIYFLLSAHAHRIFIKQTDWMEWHGFSGDAHVDRVAHPYFPARTFWINDAGADWVPWSRLTSELNKLTTSSAKGPFLMSANECVSVLLQNTVLNIHTPSTSMKISGMFVSWQIELDQVKRERDELRSQNSEFREALYATESCISPSKNPTTTSVSSGRGAGREYLDHAIQTDDVSNQVIQDFCASVFPNSIDVVPHRHQLALATISGSPIDGQSTRASSAVCPPSHGNIHGWDPPPDQPFLETQTAVSVGAPCDPVGAATRRTSGLEIGEQDSSNPNLRRIPDLDVHAPVECSEKEEYPRPSSSKITAVPIVDNINSPRLYEIRLPPAPVYADDQITPELYGTNHSVRSDVLPRGCDSRLSTLHDEAPPEDVDDTEFEDVHTSTRALQTSPLLDENRRQEKDPKRPTSLGSSTLSSTVLLETEESNGARMPPQDIEHAPSPADQPRLASTSHRSSSLALSSQRTSEPSEVACPGHCPDSAPVISSIEMATQDPEETVSVKEELDDDDLPAFSSTDLELDELHLNIIYHTTRDSHVRVCRLCLQLQPPVVVKYAPWTPASQLVRHCETKHVDMSHVLIDMTRTQLENIQEELTRLPLAAS